MEQKITAGRDELGGFAPKFAQLNDDVLFGEVWAREEALSARDRSIVTVTALMAGGMTMTFQAVEETLVRPAVTGLVSLLLFVVLFAIFAFLARRLSGLAGWVCRSPLLQPADRFLGGVIGAGEALVELYLICVALQLVLAFFGDMTYLNRQILGDTIIWSWLGNFDFSALLG